LRIGSENDSGTTSRLILRGEDDDSFICCSENEGEVDEDDSSDNNEGEVLGCEYLEKAAEEDYKSCTENESTTIIDLYDSDEKSAGSISSISFSASLDNSKCEEFLDFFSSNESSTDRLSHLRVTNLIRH